MSDITYKVRKNARAKRMRIAVSGSDGVVVTVPKRCNQILVEQFVQSNILWIQKQVERYKDVADNPVAKLTDDDYLIYKKEARRILSERVEYFNVNLGYTYKNIFIKNQKKRWGSCSSKGNLNFNFRVMFLPDELRDYIVVHELCHLKEMNHSKKFWNLVESVLPDYKRLEKEIKEKYHF